MGVREKEFLFLAASSELGIELLSSDFEKDFMRLSQERTKDPGLKHLTIRKAPTPDHIWIVRLDELPGKPAGLDVDLKELGLV